MRAAFAILLSAALVFASGCTDSSIIEHEDGVRKLGDEPVKTVVIWHTYSDEETRVFEEEVIPEFEKAHPDIRIESVRQASNSEYQAALMARASADKTPDVIRLDYAWVPRFADRGLLYPLERFSHFDEAAGRLRSRILDANRLSGHVYGLPLNITTKAAIYNRKLLNEAGLSQPPASLPEIIDIARKRNYVIGMAGVDMWNSLPYFFGLGGKFADEKFTRTEGFLNGEESVHAVETMVKLFQEGILNPNLLVGNADLWRGIRTGDKFLMIDDGPWYYSILLNSANLDVDLMKATLPAPFPSNGQYGSVIGGESLVMTKGTKHKEEAWEFIRWMMRKETQSTLFKAGLIPTNMDAFHDGNAAGTDNRYIGPYLKGIEEAFYRPPLPHWYEIEQIYNDTMEDIFLSGGNVREKLNAASSSIDALLGHH